MFDGRESLAILHGPNTYVAPTWSAAHPATDGADAEQLAAFTAGHLRKADGPG